ncbi:hypothetical protein PUNSTDRAFT_133366 [Punctularia strigosozonata HHB-11173 SS5]|uniref:uncharacterized protein n=1 Tax=Punctularia strigosozonata (strain HHB-11173) TaxID=741275 RepID=UPI0004417417|nr:uncharacterized protein PUNSTDRAFT_133366 [Punctularia strigosozonata HHB-11173 SS5]EIN09580.1 hypothetical protein PUNSTDRAFT_133366 [Punctularia strigosozonata HHB-11173 SS5]
MSNVATFKMFNTKVKGIREKLTEFSNTLSSIARRGAILHAATRLSDHLQVVLFLFRENAASLFPQKIKMREENREYFHLRATLKHDNTGFTLESIPVQLGFLAEAITEYHDRLTEIPELRLVAKDARLMLFKQDLEYWQGYCKTLKGRFQEYVVHVYLNELLGEMEIHLDNLTTMLNTLCKVTLPRLNTAKGEQNNYLVALTAVATLFASIAATTLSLSSGQHGTLLWDFVNAFWFSSLVLSIVSVVISLVGLVWNEDLCLYPEQRFPRWISSGLRSFPMFLLVVAVLAFSAGLVLFGFSSHQHVATSSLTLGFTCISAVILLALVILFAIEDNRFKGNTERSTKHTLFDPFLAPIGAFHDIRRRIGDVPSAENSDATTESTPPNQLAGREHRSIGKSLFALGSGITRVMAMAIPPPDDPSFPCREVDIDLEVEAYDSVSADSRSSTSHGLKNISPEFKRIVGHNIPLPQSSVAPADIQFLMIGSYLASSGWDKRVRIWNVKWNDESKAQGKDDVKPYFRQIAEMQDPPKRTIESPNALVSAEGFVLQTVILWEATPVKILYWCISVGHDLYDSRMKRSMPAVPTLTDISNVVVNKEGTLLLVNHDGRPPQLFDVTLKASEPVIIPRLPYAAEARFTGRGAFWGRNDEYVLRGDRDGNIHVWDTETGQHKHTFLADKLKYVKNRKYGARYPHFDSDQNASAVPPYLFGSSLASTNGSISFPMAFDLLPTTRILASSLLATSSISTCSVRMGAGKVGAVRSTETTWLIPSRASSLSSRAVRKSERKSER